jgi:hypothetical protein
MIELNNLKGKTIAQVRPLMLGSLAINYDSLEVIFNDGTSVIIAADSFQNQPYINWELR